MAIVEQSNSGAQFSSLLAPFTTVDNGGARPLKAISAGELATLRNGDMVYTESIRDYWKWVPASTATDDSTGAAAQLRYCNPTVNGANPGRFERLFVCSPDWLIQNFTINNATGHNEGDGIILPINNDKELYQRWGNGRRVTITTAINITYAQTPTIQTNLVYDLISGGSVNVFGTPIVTKAGTVLTAIQLQVRTSGAELGWAITGVGLAAADVGKIVVITASGTPANVNAYAGVLKDETGGKLRVSPFGTYNIVNGTFTLITPQVGDTIEIREMATVLSIGKWEVNGSLNDSTSLPSRTVFDSISLDGGALAGGHIYNAGAACYYARINLRSITLNGYAGQSSAVHTIRGGSVASGNGVVIRGLATFSQTGFLGALNCRYGSKVILSSDVYFQNATVSSEGTVSSGGIAVFDRTVADQVILIQTNGGSWAQVGAVPDWGANNAGHAIKVIGPNGNYGYSTKPTINGGLPGAGRQTLVGGTDKDYAAIPYIEGANNASLVLIA